MIAFPNCKINLGLNIVGKRNDGYHNLETVFYPLDLRDAIEIVEEKSTQNTMPDSDSYRDQFSISGLKVEGDVENNICVKAYHLLKKDFPDLPPVKMHLHKTIPSGAGLGGGSADGAFTLKLLNKKFNLNLTENKLLEYALLLGSDCPFFIINKPCFAEGRGELMQEIEVELSAYKILIVYPGIHINTSEAFSNIKPGVNKKSISEIIKQPIASWQEELYNDFEKPVFNQYPEIKKIKEKLYNAGAIYSSMSGSGSSVYGFFEKEKVVQVSFPENYMVKELFCQF